MPQQPGLHPELCLRDETEPTVLGPEVAKQPGVFARTFTFGVFASSRASFGLDKICPKLGECFNEDLPKLALSLNNNAIQNTKQ